MEIGLFPEPSHVAENPAYDSAPAAAPEAQDMQNGAEVCDPSDNEEGSGLEEEIIQEPPSKSSQNETVIIAASDLSAGQEEKKSYASIVR